MNLNSFQRIRDSLYYILLVGLSSVAIFAQAMKEIVLDSQDLEQSGTAALILGTACSSIQEGDFGVLDQDVLLTAEEFSLIFHGERLIAPGFLPGPMAALSPWSICKIQGLQVKPTQTSQDPQMDVEWLPIAPVQRDPWAIVGEETRPLENSPETFHKMLVRAGIAIEFFSPHSAYIGEDVFWSARLTNRSNKVRKCKVSQLIRRARRNGGLHEILAEREVTINLLPRESREFEIWLGEADYSPLSIRSDTLYGISRVESLDSHEVTNSNSKTYFESLKLEFRVNPVSGVIKVGEIAGFEMKLTNTQSMSLAGSAEIKILENHLGFMNEGMIRVSFDKMLPGATVSFAELVEGLQPGTGKIQVSVHVSESDSFSREFTFVVQPDLFALPRLPEQERP